MAKTMKQSIAVESSFVFALVLLVYLVTGMAVHSGDTITSSLFGFNYLDNGHIDFDNFRGSYLDTSDSYWFLESKSGHLTSLFPWGTALVAFPTTFCYWLFLHFIQPGISITQIAFEPHRILSERISAAVIAAASSCCFYMASRLRYKFSTSIATTLIFAFATNTWVVSSQALWQHGATNLCLIVVIVCIVDINTHWCFSRRAQIQLVVVGIMCGLLPWIRPANLIFSLSTIGYCLLCYRKNALWTAAAIVPFLAGILYNEFYFHNFLGGYQGLLSLKSFTLTNLVGGATGCLFSPGRGLFVYTPLIVFSFIVVIRNLKRARELDKTDWFILILFSSTCITCSLYFVYKIWWGGACYGPRYMTEAMPVSIYLLNYFVDSKAHSLSKKILLFIFWLFAIISLSIQAVGVLGRETSSSWNVIPLNVDQYPSRLWQVQDCPIERSAKSFLGRQIFRQLSQLGRAKPNPGISARGLSGYVVGFSNVDGQNLRCLDRGVKEPLRVEVRNEGQVQWLGYESGSDAFATFVYVQVSFSDLNNRLIERAGGDLPISHAASSGEPTVAIGEVTTPITAGRYKMNFHVHCFYVPETLNKTKDLSVPISVH